MRTEILLSSKIADQLVKSNFENLKQVGEKYFSRREYDKTHDEYFVEGMEVYEEEEIEATKEEISFLGQIGAL